MTYEAFFNLDDAPFRLTPDPEYYFPSKQHSEALQTLLYCVETGEGFVQITGEPGVGKTLLIRSFLDQLGDDVNTALILHPRLGAEELFKVILEDLGLAHESTADMSKESLLRSFRDILLKSAKKGIRTVVIIDEAQEIPEKTLEELRLLSNLETEKTKLLQIILVGQPEFEEKLNRDSLKQLHQRITNRYRLDILTLDETVNYIQHRLKVAGGGNISRFSLDIIKQVHAISHGVPRIINTICERALMAAYVDGKSTVNREHLNNAVQSLEYNAVSDHVRSKSKKQIFFYLFLLLILAGAGLYFSNASFEKIIDLKTEQLTTFLQTLKTDSIASLTPGGDETTADTLALQENLRTAPVEQSDSSDNGGNEDIGSESEEQRREGRQPVQAELEKEIAAVQETSAENMFNQASSQTESGRQAEPLGGEKPGMGDALNDPQEYEYSRILPQEVSASPEQAATEDAVQVEGQQVLSVGAKCFALLGPGWSSITIRQKKAVQFLANDGSAPVKERLLPAGTTLGNGIYLLGREKDTPFLFNHRSFFSWQEDPSLASWLWSQFAGETCPPVIPVVVSSRAAEQPPDQVELAAVRETVRKWAAAFNRKDIDNLMTFYDDPLLNYRVFRNNPTVKSRAEVTAKKTKVFKKNKAISLQISEPTCIIDSEDPSQAMAVFYQRFISSSYRDTGIKVLFLRKTDSDTIDRPPWIITGRLWLPGDDNKKKSAD